MTDHAHPPPSETATGPLVVPRRLWLLVLVAGAVVWLTTAVITAATNDTILVPTLILLGSFLVPLTVVMFALSRSTEGGLTAEALVLAFLGGGTIGLPFAALTEVYFLPSTHGTFLTVGLMEEGAKGIVLAAAASFVATRAPRDGIVLGAVVGAGFGAFETAGYALSTLIRHGDDDPVLNVVRTEVSRAIIAPFGHITWTAILGGALFAASRSGLLRVTAGVLWTFIGVVLLHAAWDASTGWAITITEGLVGGGWDGDWPNVKSWVGTPTATEAWTFGCVYWVLLGANALIGTVWLVRGWRRFGAGVASSEDRDRIEGRSRPARDS